MKASAWRRLARQYLLPSLPEVRLAGPILVFGEVDWILHALVLETSAFSVARVRLSALNQPLYVPFEGMIATFGEVLGHPRLGHEWWDVDPNDEEALAKLILEAIRRQAHSAFERANSPAALAAYSERRYPGSMAAPNIQVEAYSWALVGNTAKFMDAYGRIQRAVTSMPASQPWVRPILERARAVRGAIEGGPDAVLKLLGRWRDDSVRQHKLEKLTTPYTADHW